LLRIVVSDRRESNHDTLRLLGPSTWLRAES